MAHIYPGLKKVGPFWHYELRVNGQRLHGSTRATDLATAKKILETIRREALEGQHRIVSRIPTLKDLYELWRSSHERVFSPKHLVSVECIYRRWIQPRLGSRRVDQIAGRDVGSLRADVLAEGRSGRYANNILQVLRLLLNYAVKMGVLRAVPVQIRMHKLQRKPRPTISAGQVPDFLAAAGEVGKNPQVGVMLRTLVALGLREGELLGMRWEWFDPEHRTYTVGKAKGKEARVLPIPTWLWDVLLTMPRTLSEWVFPAHDGKPHRSGFLRKPLARLAKSLDLGNLTQHRLRATFATLHAGAGTPITDIQGMLGHKSITTTMIYVEQSLAAKRRAQDALGQKLGLA